MNAIAVPFAQYTDTVRPEWIDQNDHLNSGHYKTLADNSTRCLFAVFRAGIDPAQSSDSSFFQAEMHICYHRELRLGDAVAVRTWIVAAEPKKIHLFHEVLDGDSGQRAATVEQLMLHIDLRTRRTAPMPEMLYTNVRALADEHAKHAMPAEIGRSISMRR
jgi:acyl-CoA thioester hydrolase